MAIECASCPGPTKSKFLSVSFKNGAIPIKIVNFKPLTSGKARASMLPQAPKGIVYPVRYIACGGTATELRHPSEEHGPKLVTLLNGVSHATGM